MHTPEQPPPPPSEPPKTLLDLSTGVLSLFLLSSLTAGSFVGRWQLLQSKLCSLRLSLLSISESPHWNDNSLLHTLFPSLLSTLQRLKALSDQCTHSSLPAGNCSCKATSTSLLLLSLTFSMTSICFSDPAFFINQTPSFCLNRDLVPTNKILFFSLEIYLLGFRLEALESLLQVLSKDEKAVAVVAKEGNIGYLISLLEVNSQPLIREQAILAVSMLASSSEDSRKIIFEEGGLGPLLRILETGYVTLKENAAVSVEAITADAENAWAISAYGGVSVLIEACRSGSQPTQTHAVGALRNAASVEDIRPTLGEEGAVPVLIQLLVTGPTAAQEKAAGCLFILASSGEYFRDLIIQEKGLPRLIHAMMQELSSSYTVEHVLRTISSVSVTDSVSRILSSSTIFIVQLCEFIKHGNMISQQISASILSKISISDGNKRAISSCMCSLVKLMD